MDIVEIRYTRPPDRVTVFRQQLVRSNSDCTITLLEGAGLAKPVMARDRVVLDRDAPVVWFTFPGAWHDIGRFHLRDGSFTGFYANILTPVQFHSPLQWETTDLFLDVWVDQEGAALLDEDELEDAVAAGAVNADAAARARNEADRLLRLAADGAWPPDVCRDVTLERARSMLAGTRGTRRHGGV